MTRPPPRPSGVQSGAPQEAELVARRQVVRLVAGSYPPLPGAPAAATVAAVRRAWAQGRDVVVVSPRVSAAPEVAPLAGRAAGGVLARLQREHGCAEVVVCMEPGLPFRSRDGGGGAVGSLLGDLRAGRAARRLARVLASFESAEVVVTGDLGVPDRVLALLWPAVNLVTAGSEETARALRAAGAPFVRVVEPFAGAGLRPPGASLGPPGTGVTRSTAGVAPPSAGQPAAAAQVGLPQGSAVVTPLGPADLLLRHRARRLTGAVARRVLGRRAPGAVSFLQRLAGVARPPGGAEGRPHARTDGSQGRRRRS